MSIYRDSEWQSVFCGCSAVIRVWPLQGLCWDRSQATLCHWGCNVGMRQNNSCSCRELTWESAAIENNPPKAAHLKQLNSMGLKNKCSNSTVMLLPNTQTLTQKKDWEGWQSNPFMGSSRPAWVTKVPVSLRQAVEVSKRPRDRWEMVVAFQEGVNSWESSFGAGKGFQSCFWNWLNLAFPLRCDCSWSAIF